MTTGDQPKPKRHRRTRAQIEADKAAEQARREELAAQRAANIPMPVAPKFSKTFHIVCEAGLTFAGKVWYRGEEIVIEEGTVEFDLAFDRKGNFAFGKTEYEQMRDFGEIRYREGPWPYGPYDLSIYEPGQLDESGKKITASPSEIKILEKVNRKRNFTT